MNGIDALMIIAGACTIWAAVSAVLLTRALDEKGMPTPFVLMRWRFLSNLGRYRDVTKKETGRVGPLFYSFVIPINAAWVFALLAIVFHLARG